jgi:ABC-type nitrate/sulfonate/bicarbonate transport system substrate-binding protein
MKWLSLRVRGPILFAVASGLLLSAAQAQSRFVRMGFQKSGDVILLKGAGGLDAKLDPFGYTAEWREFPSGPPLLEAINVGAIDFGHFGETPPIFGQAAGAPFLYVAQESPAPKGEAILVPRDSPIKSVAQLKGKKIALDKGSNVHYLLVRVAETDSQVLDAIIGAIADVDAWANGRERAVAKELSGGIGIPAQIFEITLRRQTYGVRPLDTETVAEQQRLAETFYGLGLLPKPIVVSTVVRKAGL